MSSVMRPSGQLPPGVYWRRRLVLLAIVLLVVWGLARLLGGGGDDPQPKASPKAAAATTAAPTPTPAPTTPAPSPKTRKAKDVEVPVRLAAVTGSCPTTGVAVRPSVVGAHEGSAVPITLRVSSTASTACTVRLDSSSLVVGVADDDGTLWDSTKCPTIQARTVDLQPGWEAVVDVAWDGRASGDDCETPGARVRTGTYQVRAAVLGAEPASSTFTLAPAPPPSPSPSPSVSPSAKPSASASPKPGAKPSGEPSAKPTTKPSASPAG